MRKLRVGDAVVATQADGFTPQGATGLVTSVTEPAPYPVKVDFYGTVDLYTATGSRLVGGQTTLRVMRQRFKEGDVLQVVRSDGFLRKGQCLTVDSVLPYGRLLTLKSVYGAPPRPEYLYVDGRRYVDDYRPIVRLVSRRDRDD